MCCVDLPNFLISGKSLRVTIWAQMKGSDPGLLYLEGCSFFLGPSMLIWEGNILIVTHISLKHQSADIYIYMVLLTVFRLCLNITMTTD